jgi:8-oxo-dGTP diphosphatase
MSTEGLLHIRVVAAVIEQDGHFLITQRRAGGSLGGLWEFPSGRVEEGELDEVALQREVRERVDVSIEVGGQLASRTHSYDGYVVDIALYKATLTAGQSPQPTRVDDLRWVLPADLENYRFPAADQETTDQLLGISRAAGLAGAA